MQPLQPRRRRLAPRPGARRAPPPRLPGRQPLRPAGQGPHRPPRRDRAARPRRAPRQDQRHRRKDDHAMTFDLNDAEPQKTGELIPDGTFAKVTMTLRPGGIDGESEIDRGLLKRSGDRGQRRADARLRVHRRRGPARPAEVLADTSPSPAARSTRTASVDRRWNITKSTLPGDDRQRARARSRGQSEAAKAKRVLRGFAASRRHHLRRQDQGRAGVEPELQGRRTSSPTW